MTLVDHCHEIVTEREASRGLRIRLGRELDSLVRRSAMYHESSIADVVRRCVGAARNDVYQRRTTVAEICELSNFIHKPGEGSAEIVVPGFLLASGETPDFVRGAVARQREKLKVTDEMIQQRIDELDALISAHQGKPYIIDDTGEME